MPIEVTGIDEEQQALKILQQRLGHMQPIMAEIGNMLVNEIDETFDDQGRPKWVQLSRTTLRLGYTGMGKNGAHTHKKDGRLTSGFERYISDKKILQTSGRLRGSFTYEATNDSVIVGTNVIYARIQNDGGMAGRGKKVKIPARRMIPVDDSGTLRPSIRAKIMDYLEKKIEESV